VIFVVKELIKTLLFLNEDLFYEFLNFKTQDFIRFQKERIFSKDYPRLFYQRKKRKRENETVNNLTFTFSRFLVLSFSFF